jgi:hypothetical protein
MSLITFETRQYRLRGASPLLGSQPGDPDIRRRYLMDKAREAGVAGVAVNENNDLPENYDQKGLTVFMRDKEYEGALYLAGYAVKGMIKEALTALKSQVGLTQPRSKVDNLFFMKERKLHILRDGRRIYGPDSINERPLRAETMQGPRTALAASEQIDDPWALEFEVTLMPGEKTKRSEALSWEHIETALEYGRYKGLGQWRNAAYGCYSWERVDNNA